MATRLLFLGHAGFYIEHNGLSVLMDPWLSEGGAFLGSWHQWPDNSDMVKRFPEILSPTYLWISHAHEDHLDRDFLQKVDKAAQILLPAFPSAELKNELTELGFATFHVIGQLESFDLGQECKAVIVMEEPLYSEHSSLYVDMPGLRFFHNSDSAFERAMLRDFAAQYPVDIFAAQHAPVGPFPHVMEWSDQQKAPFIEQNLEWTLDRFTQMSQDIKAPYVIPCASPAVKLAPEAWDETLKIMQTPAGPFDLGALCQSIEEHLPAVQVIRTLPGFEISAQDKNTAHYTIPAVDLPDYDQRIQMLHAYKEKRKPAWNRVHPACDIEDIKALQDKQLRKLLALAPLALEPIKTRVNIVFYERSDQSLLLDLIDCHNPQCQIIDGKLDPLQEKSPCWRLYVHATDWTDFITGRISYEHITLSRAHSSLHNDTGFSADLSTIWRYSHSNQLLKELNKELHQLDNSTFDISHNDQTYTLQKRCPHQGASLEDCVPDENGMIQCPAHGWKFDIKTGQCVSGDVKASIAVPDKG